MGRVIEPGEELMVDINSHSKPLKHRPAFDKFTGAMAAVDLSTRYKIGKLLKSILTLKFN